MNTNIKLSKKKRQLLNVSKQKLNRGNQKSNIVAIRSLSNLDKKDLPISTFMPIFNKSIIDITMISTNGYYMACKLKGPRFLLFL